MDPWTVSRLSGFFIRHDFVMAFRTRSVIDPSEEYTQPVRNV